MSKSAHASIFARWAAHVLRAHITEDEPRRTECRLVLVGPELPAGGVAEVKVRVPHDLPVLAVGKQGLAALAALDPDHFKPADPAEIQATGAALSIDKTAPAEQQDILLRETTTFVISRRPSSVALADARTLGGPSGAPLVSLGDDGAAVIGWKNNRGFWGASDAGQLDPGMRELFNAVVQQITWRKTSVDALAWRVALAEAEKEEQEKAKDTEQLQQYLRTAPPPPTSIPRWNGRLQRPVAGPLTSPFGLRLHPVLGRWILHKGQDIGSPSGKPVYAAYSGQVGMRQPSRRGYGNRIVLLHGGGWATTYNHLSGFNVQAGQVVRTGQVIGFVGSTGMSTGPHLHFEVMQQGKHVNPRNYLMAHRQGSDADRTARMGPERVSQYQQALGSVTRIKGVAR